MAPCSSRTLLTRQPPKGRGPRGVNGLDLVMGSHAFGFKPGHHQILTSLRGRAGLLGARRATLPPVASRTRPIPGSTSLSRQVRNVIVDLYFQVEVSVHCRALKSDLGGLQFHKKAALHHDFAHEWHQDFNHDRWHPRAAFNPLNIPPP